MNAPKLVLCSAGIPIGLLGLGTLVAVVLWARLREALLGVTVAA